MTAPTDPHRHTASQPLQVSLLGALRITIGDRPIGLRGAKGAGLLATLAVEASQPGTRISSERLRDTIWPGTEPETSKRRLETAINSLRRTVGAEYFSHGTPYYFLAATRVRVDVHQFLSGARRLVTVGIGADQVDAANELLDMWRGEPAPEFTECDWHRDLTAQLTEARTALELAVAAHHDSIGQHAEASRHLRSVLRRNETHQGACVQLMRSLYLDNRSNDAIDIYQQMVGLLLDEYGLDPVPELEQTYLAILNNDVDRPEQRASSAPVRCTCWYGEIAREHSLLGRDAELDELTEFFLRAPAPPRPRLALITGASGIGKSRFIRELAERGSIGQSANDAVLFGRANPVDNSPFQLIADVIRRMHRHRPEVFGSLSPIGKGLVSHLLPDLFPLPPNAATALDTDVAFPSEPMVEILGGAHDVPRQTAVQLHSLGHELFDRIRGEGGRVVLVIDDAHHLTADTLSVLNFLLTVPSFSMLDVVCTLRPTTDGHEDELLRLARSMELHDTARILHLEPLNAPDSIALATEATHGRWDSAVAVADIPELTGGNPLLITYVIRAILDDRSLTFDPSALAAPASPLAVTAATERRIPAPNDRNGASLGRDEFRSPPALDRALQHLVDQVGTDSRQFLTAACVWQGPFSASLVSRVAGQLHGAASRPGPNGSLEHAVERLIALRLLRDAESSDGALTFSHELLRRQLYSQLGRPTRERIHLLTATALEEADERGHLIEPSQIAHHLRLAGDLCEPERVADALLASADFARRGWSRRAEIAELERALPYLESSKLLAKRAEALTDLGEAEARLHGMESSAEYLREAAAAARTLGDWNLFARIALLFGGSIPLGDYYGAESIQLVAEALEHLSDGPTHVRALLLARGAQLGFYELPASTRRHQCERAERLVASSGLATKAAIALHSFWALDGATEMDEQWARLAIVQQAADELNDRYLMMNAAKCQVHLHLGYGNLEAADQAARSLAAHAVRSEDLEFRRLSVQYDAMREMSRGNFELGYRFADQVFELLTNMGRGRHAGFVQTAQDLSARMVKGTVGVCAPRFRRIVTEDSPVSAWAWAESELGPSRAADELLRGVWRRWESHVRTPERWLTVVATLSAAIRLENDEMVERAAIRLEREEQGVCRIASLAYFGLASFHLGRAAKFRGETDLAREHFRQSLDRSFRIGTKPWAIWAAAELASVGGELPPEMPTTEAILEGARAFGLVQVAKLMAVEEQIPTRSTMRSTRPGAPTS